MRIIQKKLIPILLSSLFCLPALAAEAGGYEVVQRLPLGAAAKWDYLSVDVLRQRLFVTHSDRVDVLEIPSGKLVGSIADTQGVHGVAIAQDLKLGFTSNGKADSVTVFDLDTLAVKAQIQLAAKNPDAILYEPTLHRVYVFNGGSANVAVIDATAFSVVGSIKVSGKPEFAVSDGNGKIFFNVEDKSEIGVIDVKSNQVVAQWPLKDCKDPTGLAIDAQNARLFSACANGIMAVTDANSGKRVTQFAIGEHPDAVIYVADTRSVLTSGGGGTGTLSIAHQDDANHSSVQPAVVTAKGAKTMAMNPMDKQVYLPAMMDDKFVLLVGAPRLPSSGSALDKIKTVVVIYAENRSFDNLYGLFPGANGIAHASATSTLQLDRDGKTVLPTLPPVYSAPATAAAAWAFVAQLPNKPFRIDAEQPGGAPGSAANVTSPDLVHRFYNNQMQINGGANNLFAAYSDAGGLSMGYYDGSSMAMWKIAQRYTLADNFFMGAFGGSFLNHVWLICACTPSSANAPADRASIVDAATGQLSFKTQAPASALSAAPGKVYAGDFNYTPKDSASGLSYAVNTTQPAFQPSGTPPAAGGDPRLADPTAKGSAAPLPPQTAKTIGDTLSAKGVNWVWYSGAWRAALADGTQAPSAARTVIYNNAGGAANFQAHHQPFNYFARFDPTTVSGQTERAAHLKDYADLQSDIAAGTLPPVVFYKPQGSLNQHPGYTDVMSGDAHIAELVTQLQASPQWKNMAIIVTYDENGGFWDHAAPPKADRWGPGTRIPTIIISPYARKGHVDSTPSDTTSIIKFITRRFGLEPLPGARAQMGDLSSAFDLSQP